MAAASALRADTDMKSSNHPDPAAKGALCAADGPKSACGLPSNVVIDMSKAAVTHTDAEWRALLTPEQYRVARLQGTEPSFHNAYWDNHEDGENGKGSGAVAHGGKESGRGQMTTRRRL